MSNAETIAAGLTKAQREAVMSATVKPPHATFMPDYHAVSVPGVCDNAAVEELRKIGVWTLPLRTGNYGHTVEWRGEIHTIGLEVRAILEKSNG